MLFRFSWLGELSLTEQMPFSLTSSLSPSQNKKLTAEGNTHTIWRTQDSCSVMLFYLMHGALIYKVKVLILKDWIKKSRDMRLSVRR